MLKFLVAAIVLCASSEAQVTESVTPSTTVSPSSESAASFTERSALFGEMDDFITTFENRVEAFDDLLAFSSEEEEFAAILGDAKELMRGGGANLLNPQFEAIRDQLKSIYGLSFQSEDKLAKSTDGKMVVFRSRLLHRSPEGKTIVINEEHRSTSDQRAYTLILVSELGKESKALKVRDQLAIRFAKLSTVARLDKNWWGDLLVPRAHAATESARARGAGNSGARGQRPRTTDKIPHCVNVGIRDQADIRSVGEPRVTPREFVSSCGAQIKNSALAVGQSLMQLMGPTTVSQTGVGWLDRGINSTVNSLPVSFRMMANAVSMSQSAAQAMSGRGLQFLTDIWNEVSNQPCLSNAARMRYACAVLETVLSVAAPGGVAAGAAKMSAAVSKAAIKRAAQQQARNFVGRAGERAAAQQMRTRTGLVYRGPTAADGAQVARQVLGRTLTQAQSQALHRAHLLPLNDIAGKTQILRQAGFSFGERQHLMRLGIAGDHGHLAKPLGKIVPTRFDVNPQTGRPWLPYGAPMSTDAESAMLQQAMKQYSLESWQTRIVGFERMAVPQQEAAITSYIRANPYRTSGGFDVEYGLRAFRNQIRIRERRGGW